MREVHSVASAITKQTVVWTGEQLYIGWSGKASWKRGGSSWEWKMTRASHVKTGGKEFQAQGRVQANVWDQRNPNVAEMRDQCQSKESDTYAKCWWSFPRKTSLESLPLPPVPCPSKMPLCYEISPFGYQPVLYGLETKWRPFVEVRSSASSRIIGIWFFVNVVRWQNGALLWMFCCSAWEPLAPWQKSRGPLCGGKPDERTHTLGLAFLQHLLEITGRSVSPLTQCPVEVSMLPGKFQLYSLGPKSACLHLRLRATSSLASGQKLPILPPGTRMAAISKGTLFHSHQM